VSGGRAALRRRLDRLLRRPIPLPPAALAEGIGGGDFRATGERIAGLAIAEGSLGRDVRLLDVGCGLGRIVQPLRRHLSRRASYVGLDIAPAYVAWDEAEISSRDPRFRFEHLDLANPVYRREAGGDAALATFPFAPGSFDFAVAFSLFTHLRAAATERYLLELGRVLAPGGRLLATFFLLDDETRSRIAAGRTDRRFAHPLPHGATDDAERPELAIAFESAWLLAALERAGLRLARPVARGTWCGEQAGPTYQDLLIAYNPPRVGVARDGDR
jgi:SAM-dependent methyltransferase